MYQLSSEMLDTATKLASLISESKELAALHQAEQDAENDPELIKRVADYVTARTALDTEAAKESPDPERIIALSHESEEAEGAIKTVPAYIASEECRRAFNDMMQAISTILQSAIGSNSTSTCSGNCSSCSGCSNG